MTESRGSSEVQSSSGTLPSRDFYPGRYKFSALTLIESDTSKWTFSPKLNKLYIKWKEKVSIQFDLKSDELGLYIRALPVYSSSEHMETPVKRCFLHSQESDPSNEGLYYKSHVIRSDDSYVIYDFNKDSSRTSVIVALGLHPETSATINYEFMCWTSCNTGMMRRPITIIFTLERYDGEVLGRQSINVKICSSPKQNRTKEEAAAAKKSK